MTEIVRKDALTINNLEPFYNLYGTLYNDAAYDHRLIFNLDETSVNFTDKYRAKIISKESDPPLVLGRPDRTPSCTLVFCIAAIGPALSTCLLWPQANVPPELDALRVHNIYVHANSSGWETKSSFEHIMFHIYIPEMIRRRSQIRAEGKKILLVLDGHSSRLSLPIILTCIRYNITILVLPAHSSALTQPNDRGVNSVFKSWFSKVAADRVNSVVQLHFTGPPELDTVDPPLPHVEEEEFPPIPTLARSQQMFDKTTAKSFRDLLISILPISIEHALRSEVVSSAWYTSGLHPFNKSVPLGCLPTGNSENHISTRKGLDISGKILTSFEMELAIMRWTLDREQALSAKELDERERRERLEIKFREARQQAEQIQKQIRDEEEANAGQEGMPRRTSPHAVKGGVPPRTTPQALEGSVLSRTTPQALDPTPTPSASQPFSPPSSTPITNDVSLVSTSSSSSTRIKIHIPRRKKSSSNLEMSSEEREALDFLSRKYVPGEDDLPLPQPKKNETKKSQNHNKRELSDAIKKFVFFPLLIYSVFIQARGCISSSISPDGSRILLLQKTMIPQIIGKLRPD